MTPYPFTSLSELSFEFRTDGGIGYAAYFVDYGWMFDDYDDVKSYVYAFNIDVVAGNPKLSAMDERIGVTVVEIFRAFFAHEDNVAVYICESLDNRQLARKRKFDRWFWKYNDGSIIKEDQLAVVEGVSIYNTLLIRKDHGQAALITQAFRELNARDHDNK